MINEEALKIIKVARVTNDTWGFYDDKAFMLAIEALKKQIPKKPMIVHEPFYDDYVGFKIIRTKHQCPICRDEIVKGNRCSNNNCGQAILWESEE